jgi:quinolinate synthase
MPEKTFIPGPTDHCACSECRYMKMNTLEKAVQALENLAPEVTLTQEIIGKAKSPIERMLEWSRN